AGGVLGALLAPLIGHALMSYLPEQGGALSAALDLRVLLFAVAMTVLTTLLFGVAPAFYAASVRPAIALKEQSFSVTGSLRVRKALIVGQFALALILLIGAGLFARTLGHLQARGPGFPTANLLMFSLMPGYDGYDAAAAKPLFRRLLADLEALPDVEQVGAAVHDIVTPGSWNNMVTVESTERIITDNMPMNGVTADFFDALGLRLIRGRPFNEHDAIDDADTEWALRSAIVNEEFVRRYLPDTDHRESVVRRPPHGSGGHGERRRRAGARLPWRQHRSRSQGGTRQPAGDPAQRMSALETAPTCRM
ncbi:MAG: ABC transporter permease, partial [Vicinamibacteraceae bacterium]